ncbi:hypothetical protein BpHYR1_011665 [Brachionus plicatilis]|uniref:Uncharacterized protein n=1 Tax=Brachionus plicatilis TaxID=10195 RepID=A0A3M7RSD4_BRAPC|nr:hypothetical protein BpHYR1_011665 [Brachionus plicatilis]
MLLFGYARDPHPFTVTSMKGSMIEATRCYPQVRKVARNSSFFKLYIGWSISDENTSNTIPVTPNTARESTPRRTQTSSAEQEKKRVLTTRSQPCSAPTVELEESGADAPEPASSINAAPETRTRSMEATKIALRPVGRPTSEESYKIQMERQAALAIQTELNPPARRSSRLASKAAPENNHLSSERGEDNV